MSVSGRRFPLFSFETARGQIIFGQMAGLARAVFNTTTNPKADGQQASTTTNSLCVKRQSIHGSLKALVYWPSHEFDLSILYFSLYLFSFDWVPRAWQGPTVFAFVASTIFTRLSALLFGYAVCSARRPVETSIIQVSSLKEIATVKACAWRTFAAGRRVQV